MDQNKYLDIMFRWMYADFCSAVRQSDDYKSLNLEEQQITETFLNGDNGKNYFLRELSRQVDKTQGLHAILDASGANKFIDCLGSKIQNMVETTTVRALSEKHNWQPVA